ncbi:TIGR04255 family protein [Cupriavidus sp. AU9028]|uniref:TIGR04255 family protein n=1 Tax=Cupriavidus sp. AU9028 TaxID=2871157 RepID=UPI001C97C15A|nr:TIGR04255 family protein [Cupriavidus sp. AU9028]MBY4898845.1 TIGR04255 family protein [Cupriavidus sp. AU9028]
MLKRIPTRLGKEPLVDALFQIRFLSVSSSLATLLPGFLFARNVGVLPGIQRLPLADIPQHVRDNTPELQYHPLLRIEFEHFFATVGDKVVVIGCKLPYPGWTSFKAKILEVLDGLGPLDILSEVELVSLKYVDVLEKAAAGDGISQLEAKVEVAGRVVSSGKTMLRTSFLADGLSNDLQLFTPFDGEVAGRGALQGIAIEVETTMAREILTAPPGLEAMPQHLDRLHGVNKSVFFDVLTEEVVGKLDPIYE